MNVYKIHKMGEYYYLKVEFYIYWQKKGLCFEIYNAFCFSNGNKA